MTKRIKSLKDDINIALNSWNERSSLKLGGVENLSRSDLEILLMYVEYYEVNGSYEGYLMKPLGSIAKVLEVYGYER